MTAGTERSTLICGAIDALFKALHMHHKCIENRLDNTEIHRGQRKLLMLLSRSSEGVSQKEIADRFEISPACVARTLKSLSTEGYILRDSDKADSRKNRVRISEKGMSVIEDTRQVFDELDARMFEGFTEAEIAAFTAQLGRLHNNLSSLL